MRLTAFWVVSARPAINLINQIFIKSLELEGFFNSQVVFKHLIESLKIKLSVFK
jgi:hypothetical protein